jgi:hypothetical protein
MLLPRAGTDTSGMHRSPVYVRHGPERTLLGQIIEEFLHELRTHLA